MNIYIARTLSTTCSYSYFATCQRIRTTRGEDAQRVGQGRSYTRRTRRGAVQRGERDERIEGRGGKGGTLGGIGRKCRRACGWRCRGMQGYIARTRRTMARVTGRRRPSHQQRHCRLITGSGSRRQRQRENPWLGRSRTCRRQGRGRERRTVWGEEATEAEKAVNMRVPKTTYPSKTYRKCEVECEAA